MIAVIIVISTIFEMLLCSSNQKTISYNFIVNHSKSNIESMLYLSFLSTDEFCIGTPDQCGKVQFDPGSSLTAILNKQSHVISDDDQAFYAPNESSTYKETPRYSDLFSSQKAISAICSIESISFGKFQLKEAQFFLANNWNSELHYSSMGISSNLEDPTYHSFVGELFDLQLINKKQFTILLNNDYTQGQIIFGDDNNSAIVNQYIANKEFNLTSQSYYIIHLFELKQISINNIQALSRSVFISFDEAFSFIQMPSQMTFKLEEMFTNKVYCTRSSYSPQRREKTNTNYACYFCPKDSINMALLSDIVFEFADGELKLKKEDLFIDYNSTTVLLSIIVRRDDNEQHYVIGKPILKDYIITRDISTKTFIFYSKSPLSFNLKWSLNNQKIIMLYFVIVLLGIGSIMLLIILIKNQLVFKKLYATSITTQAISNE